MPSLLPGYEYDIFISYRHNDNRSGWVTEFVKALQEELASTIKDPVTLYFDTNPHDGLLETHNVDKSLEGKLKCLIFIPIISQTYCDPKSFAWRHEFCSFNKLASGDSFGRDIKLSNGNVASRILPVKIHDLDVEDKAFIESEMGGVLRAIEFIYKESGVNRPLKSSDNKNDNLTKADYRNQVNKTANAVKEIITSLKNSLSIAIPTGNQQSGTTNSPIKRKKVYVLLLLAAIVTLAYYLYQQKTIVADGNQNENPIEKSIAVLPFSNMSNDPEQEYFGDGLSEEIINTLVQIEGIKVIARTSSFQFKGKNEDLRNIGKALNVATILEGSVRKSSDRIRITAQLIRSSDGSHIWSKTFDASSRDILEVQEDIARHVAEQMKVTFSLTMPLTPWDQEAMKLYQQGRFYFDRSSPEDRVIASKFFEKSIQRDSTKAIVYAHLAFYYSYIDTAAFEATIKKAVELDSTLGESYIILAENARGRLDFERAAYYLQKGLQFGGSSPMCLRIGGRILSEWGQQEKAIELCKKAVELDPLKAIQYSQLGTIYLFTRNYSKAIETLRTGLALSPDLLHSHGVVALALLLSGRLDEAKLENELEKGIEFHEVLEASILFRQGKREEAQSKYLKFAQEFGPTAPYMIASLAAQIERPDDCIYWLNKAIDKKTGGTEFLLVDPFFDPMRDDPRLKQIIARLKFPKIQF